jgi:hypothetical protein
VILDCVYSAGIALDINSCGLVPRFPNSGWIPGSVLRKSASDYPDRETLLDQTEGGLTSPVVLLAACGKHQLARETCSAAGVFGGVFTAALIETLDTLPWDNLSYANLFKSLPKLPDQTPECIGASERVVFTLDEAQDAGVYFDIEAGEDGLYTVEGAGQALGIAARTECLICAPDSQVLGSLIVDDVTSRQSRAHVKLQEGHQDLIPYGVKALLQHWFLCDGPLRIAVQGGVEGLQTTATVKLVDQPSEAEVVVAKREGNLELDRRDPLIPYATAVRTVKLREGTDSRGIQNLLTGMLGSIIIFSARVRGSSTAASRWKYVE